MGVTEVLLACKSKPCQGSELSPLAAPPDLGSPFLLAHKGGLKKMGGDEQYWLNPLLSVVLITKYTAENSAVGKAASFMA